MKKRKRLGQHFLVDADAVERIVDGAAITREDLVIEIGPGRGALTRRLLDQAKRVVGIELDATLCDYLTTMLRGESRFEVLNRDILEVDLQKLVRDSGAERAVVIGNLPYQITGAVVEQVLAAREVFSRAVLMVQREVARRILASPTGSDYGVLSIAVQMKADGERLFDLKPISFDPPPKVSSTVIRLVFPNHPLVLVSDERFFFEVVRTAFQQRRKMVKNSLLGLAGGDAERLEEALAAAAVDGRARPERISISEFDRISKGIARHAA